MAIKNTLDGVVTTVNANSGSWSGGGGIDSTDIIKQAPNALAEDVTITSNYNAFAIGPLTINDGVTVTVSASAVFKVL
mgnify:CR=1 FL=1